MEERLQNKVQTLRSQGLSFAKDGIDFTLDVPDTGDVKSIFGTMADTIVSQEKVIENLTETLEKTNEDFKKSQEEMMTWAQAKFDELQHKNSVLVDALKDARSQLRNFSFNVQGFEDTSEENDLDKKLNALTSSSSSRSRGGMDEEEKVLFPTEDGAPHHSLSAESPTAAMASTVKPQVDEATTKSLLDSALAADCGAGKVEEDTRTAVQRMSPRSKWLWAYRKVLAKIRSTKLGYGFTKTRVGKSESVLERLERMEKRLFFVPIELREHSEELHGAAMDTLRAEIERVDGEHSAFSTATAENLQSLDGRITALNGDISAVQAEISTVQKTLDDTVSSQSQKLQEDINALQHQQKEDNERQSNTLWEKLRSLFQTFTSLESRAASVSSEVLGVIAANSKLYRKSGDDSISSILQVDTGMRLLRESVGQMESDVFTVSAIGKSLKEDVARRSAGAGGEKGEGGNNESVEAAVLELDRILSEGIPSISKGIEGAKEQIKVHDGILADRWISLSGMMKAISNISGLSDKLEKIECELENKVAASEVQSIGKELASAALDEFQRPLDERISAIVSDMTEQKEKVVSLEEKIRKIPEQIPHHTTAPAVPAATAPPVNKLVSPRNSAEVHAVSEVMSQPWNPADMEAQLQPLIKDIVNLYLAEWNAGSDEEFGEEEEEEGAEEFLEGTGESEEEGHVVDDTTPGTVADIENEAEATRDNADNNCVEQRELVIDTAVGDDASNGVEPEETPPPHISPRGSAERPTTTASVRNDMTDDLASPQASGAPSPAAKPTERKQASPRAAQTEARPVAIAAAPSPKNPTLPPITGVDKSKTAPPPAKKAVSVSPISRATPSPVTTRPVIKQKSSVADPPEESPLPRSKRFGRGTDSAELTKMKAELKELKEKFDTMNRTKIDVESVRTLLAQKADTKFVEKKVDGRVVSAIETAVGDMMTEIGNMKDLHHLELEKVKEQLAKRIKSSLKTVLEERNGPSKGAVVSYKGLCMSCGQTSPVPMTSGHTNPPPFLPQLSANSTDGPEVYRGGFRMPVAPHSASGSLFGGGSSSMLQEGFPEVDGEEGSFHQMEARPPPSANKVVRRQQAGSPLLSVSASYTEDSKSVRSIHRKGLKGTSSQRAAAAYAPERFELTHTELKSNSAPLVARLPRTKSVLS